MSDLVQRLREIDSEFGFTLCATAADRIAQLERENAELRKDAARYRFMRKPHMSQAEFLNVVNALDECCENELDEAIDKAMKEQT
jgi:hypothetical protein